MNGFSKDRSFARDGSADLGAARDAFFQDTKGVFTHFPSREELGEGLREIEPELNGSGWKRNSKVVVC
jgi:hypothetical protein